MYGLVISFFLVFFFCPRFLMAAIMADCGDSGGAFLSSSPLLPPHAVLPVKLPPPLGEFIRRAAELAAALFTVGDPVGDLEDRLVPSNRKTFFECSVLRCGASCAFQQNSYCLQTVCSGVVDGLRRVHKVKQHDNF